jgi:hypothetical protein
VWGAILKLKNGSDTMANISKNIKRLRKQKESPQADFKVCLWGIYVNYLP